MHPFRGFEMRGFLLPLLLASSSVLASCSTQTYPIFPAEVTDGNSRTYDRAFALQTGRGVPRDYERAAELYEEASKRGDARAENNLGVMAMRGQGRDVSYWAAASHFREAASRGSAAAHYNLGLMYDSGVGMSHDAERAVSEYRMAAEQGLPEAQLRLAVMFQYGIGTQPNAVEADRLYKMAAIRGNSDAYRRLASLAGHDLRDDDDLRAVFAVEACGDCSTDALKAMAQRDYNGLADLAAKGDAPARYDLAVRLLNGDHANQDPSEAARLFTLAARQGYGPAQRQLAQMHLRGQAVAKSKVLAHAWLNLAARNPGNEGAAARAQMEELEVSMTTDEIRQAQALSASDDFKGR
jgi:hypothetical protein